MGLEACWHRLHWHCMVSIGSCWHTS